VVDVRPAGRALPADRLEPGVAVLRFLAVAGGHASPEAMARTWPAGDAWWAVGEAPAALLRLGPGGDGPPTVREVVLVRPDAPPVEELAGAVAAALGAPVRVALPAAAGGPARPRGRGGRGRPEAAGRGGRGEPVPVREAVLPWPAGAGRAASAEPAQSP
jgi:hypothetical protein